jgi:hypothetical protein
VRDAFTIKAYDGALYSAASGGVPPITWLWNDPAAQRSANALNLRQGMFLPYTDNLFRIGFSRF